MSKCKVFDHLLSSAMRDCRDLLLLGILVVLVLKSERNWMASDSRITQVTIPNTSPVTAAPSLTPKPPQAAAKTTTSTQETTEENPKLKALRAAAKTDTSSTRGKQFKPPKVKKKRTSSKSCFYKGGPLPVILMTQGRSGSTSTWQIIQKLTGGRKFTAEEYPGVDAVFSKKELDDQIDSNGEWVLHKLCERAIKQPNDLVVGFKWKPANMDHPAFLQGLQILADYHIKVIRSRRSPLDRALSRIKHSGVLQAISPLGTPGYTGKVPAHCVEGRPSYDACIKAHQKAGTGMTVHSKPLLEELKSTSDYEDQIDDLLKKHGVQHVSISYEKLYHNDDPKEWQKIFSFLGLDASALTRQQVNEAMDHTDTSNRLHNVTIENFDEIKTALQDTPFQHLLKGT